MAFSSPIATLIRAATNRVWHGFPGDKVRYRTPFRDLTSGVFRSRPQPRYLIVDTQFKVGREPSGQMLK